MARANVKPFTHWVIYKSYSVRFSSRTPTLVTGTLTTPDGSIPFSYEPQTMLIHLGPDDEETSATQERIKINEYGWEVE